MKNQKGMGYIMLILCITIIIIVVAGIIYFFLMQFQKQVLETYETDMLLIQGKVKVLSEDAVIAKKEELLVGKKITEALETQEVKKLLEAGIISQEEPNFEKYYVLEKSNLEQMGLNTIRLKKGYYIVNYDTDEIIYTEGIKDGNNIYYKLSELEKMKDETDEVEQNSQGEEGI